MARDVAVEACQLRWRVVASLADCYGGVVRTNRRSVFSLRAVKRTVLLAGSALANGDMRFGFYSILTVDSAASVPVVVSRLRDGDRLRLGGFLLLTFVFVHDAALEFVHRLRVGRSGVPGLAECPEVATNR